MAEETYPMTPGGRDKLRARLRQLKDVERFTDYGESGEFPVFWTKD